MYKHLHYKNTKYKLYYCRAHGRDGAFPRGMRKNTGTQQE